MSRSYYTKGFKGPIPRGSEKIDKRIWHKRYRRHVRDAIKNEDEVMPHYREHSDPWCMLKDGMRGWRIGKSKRERSK